MFEDYADLNFDIENEPRSSESRSKTLPVKRKSDPGPSNDEKRAKFVFKKPVVDKVEETSRQPLLTAPKVKRKFPGPAGLISDLSPHEKSLNLTQDVSSSQATVVNTDEPQWSEMLEDFGEKPAQFTIKSLKTRADLGQLASKKSEFLAAFIQNVEYFGSNADVNLTLGDQTGTIMGIAVNKLYSDNHRTLQIGSVIVLRQVGVLTLGKNDHFLTITDKSLEAIYAKDPKSDRVMKVSLKDYSKKTRIELSEEDIVKSAFEGVDTDSLFDDF